MIKPVTRTLALLLISAATFTSCKKDKEDILIVNDENLAGTYTLGAIKMKAGTEERDVTNEYVTEACERDDEFVLHADNTYEYNDVGTKCEPDESYESEWYLENNVLYLDGLEGTIDKLSNKALVLKETYTEDNMTVTVTYILNRK